MELLEIGDITQERGKGNPKYDNEGGPGLGWAPSIENNLTVCEKPKALGENEEKSW